MKKYAKVVDDTNKKVDVFLGSNLEYASENGFKLMEVEQGYDNQWYLKGYAPSKPKTTIEEQVAQMEILIEKINIDMLRDILIIDDKEQTQEKKEEANQYLEYKKKQKNELIEKINKLRAEE